MFPHLGTGLVGAAVMVSFTCRILSVAHEIDKSQTDVLTKCAQHLKRLGQASSNHLVCGQQTLSHTCSLVPKTYMVLVKHRYFHYACSIPKAGTHVWDYINPGSQAPFFTATAYVAVPAGRNRILICCVFWSMCLKHNI